MTEDGWFGNLEKDKPQEEKEELIESTDLLIKEFDNVMNRVQMHTNEAYGAILPIATNLLGHPDDPNSGELNKIRQSLRDTRFLRTTTGASMWKAIESVEELNSWQSRYYKQLEGFLDALRKVAESSFEIIKKKDIEIQKRDIELRQFYGVENDAEMPPMRSIQPSNKPIVTQQPSYSPYGEKVPVNPEFQESGQEKTKKPFPTLKKPDKPETDAEKILGKYPKFEKMFMERISQIKGYLEEGNKQKAGLMKGAGYALAGKNPEKQILAEYLYQKYEDEELNIKN